MKTIIFTALLCTIGYYATGALMKQSDTVASIQQHNSVIVAMMEK